MRISKQARGAGLIAAVLVMISICYALFAPPAINCVADDSYQSMMEELGLAYLSGEAEVGQAVEQFAFKPFDYFSLLTPGKGMIEYAAALARLVTEPFGLNFSTRVLACAYMLIIAFGVYLMVSGLYGNSRIAAGAACAAACVLLMENTISGYLNSLYHIGGIIAAAGLFLGCMVRAFCLPRGASAWPAAGVILSVSLLLCSQAQLIVLAPFMAVPMGLAVYHLWPKGRKWASHMAIFGLALFFTVTGVSSFYREDNTLHTYSANYLAVFQGYLPMADDPVETLNYFGLDESYLPDMGRSYYDSSDTFAHNPQSEQEKTVLTNKISLNKRIAYCFEHPEFLSSALDRFTTHLYDPMNERIQSQDGNRRYVRPSPSILIGLFFSQEGFANQSGRMLTAALFCLILAMFEKGGKRKLLLSLCALNAGFLLYFPACLIFTGGVDVDYIKVVFFLFGWISFFIATTCLLRGIQLAYERLGERDDSVPAMSGLPVSVASSSFFSGRLGRISFSRKRLLWISAIACVCISCLLLLPEKHIGGINNGDYGRMMERLDIIWTEEYLEDTGLQYGQVVTENYDYREEYHLKRLTSLEPSYSLVYPAAIMRAISAVTGMKFDTRIIAVQLILMITAAILLILYDLYPLFGRATALLAVGLIAMLLGECYMGWYNSLFGEGSIIAGLVMTVACALHLCLMERGAKHKIVWFILLGFSLRFLACSKAQMALSLPFGVILFVALGIYHHPKGVLRCLSFCLVLALSAGTAIWNGFGVYQNNAGVSENATLWQSVFTGALVVAEDPIAAMEELGIDTAMAPDIGKNAYLPEAEYVYAPSSIKAQEAFYSKVSTVGMVGYYLRHPRDLIIMLNRAAEQSMTLHTGFMAYSDENYSDVSHNEPYRFNLWRDIRSLTACCSFWQYALLYGAAVIYCAYRLIRKRTAPQKKLLILLYLCILCIGFIQFPLTVIGNGMSDNNKQEAAFMLCHDLLVLVTAVMGARKLYLYTNSEDEISPEQGSERTA